VFYETSSKIVGPFHDDRAKREDASIAGMINKNRRVPFEIFAIRWQVSLAAQSPPFGGEAFCVVV